MTGTPLGLLERCHAFKEKKSKGISADAGLFTYPVLMAADILGYDSNCVPVGQDQVQHIEVARDIARSFNHHYGDCFVQPEARILDESAKVPGTDGEKMSKSYDNIIPVFEEEKALQKQIMRISTDSRAMEDAKQPETDHLYQLFCLFGKSAQQQEMAAIYRRGGFGYGDIKKQLAQAAEGYFGPARERREKLTLDPDFVQDILAAGAAKARLKAAEVLDRVQHATGLVR